MQLMKSLSLEERTVIAGRPDKDGRTALSTAVEVEDSIAFVEFLLEECGADVEQCGFVDRLGDHDYPHVANEQVV